MEEKKKNLIYGCLSVIGGILIHFTFGHFYTIANMVPYIMGYVKTNINKNLEDKAAIWLSALALGVQGLSMPIGGMIAKKLGFRIVVAVSCILNSGSILLTYFTIQRTFVGVIVTYSVFVGAGLGLGYSVVLAVASSWFPSRRGLIVGLIVGGFGLGAFVFTPIQTTLINPTNIKVDNVTRQFTDPELLDRVPRAFLILGSVLLTIQVIGFFLLRPRPTSKSVGSRETSGTGNEQQKMKQDVPHERQPRVKGNLNDSPIGSWSQNKLSEFEKQRKPVDEINVSPKQVFRRIDFYLLWVIMFFNVIPITIVTSTYKLFGQTFVSDDIFLSAVATASSIFNAGGRIIWGAIVDRVSFKIPLCTFLVLWSVFLFSFPYIALTTGVLLKTLYAVWVCILFFCLSGVFVLMPAATGNLFGPVNLAVNYGLVFNAFAFGSVMCALITYFSSTKDTYRFQYGGCGLVCLLGFFLALWMDDRKIPERVNWSRWCASTCPRLRNPPTETGTEEELADLRL